MRYLLPLIMLAGCGPIPVQISKQSQEQTQRVSQSAEPVCRSTVVAPVCRQAGNQFDACHHHLQHGQFSGWALHRPEPGRANPAGNQPQPQRSNQMKKLSPSCSSPCSPSPRWRRIARPDPRAEGQRRQRHHRCCPRPRHPPCRDPDRQQGRTVQCPRRHLHSDWRRPVSQWRVAPHHPLPQRPERLTP